MKKIICAALIFALLFTITACGSSGKEQNPHIKQESGTDVPAPLDTEQEVTDVKRALI